MTDDLKDGKNFGEENFEELLKSYDTRGNEDIQIGDKIKGEIIAIGKDSLFISTGTKIDGVVDKEELLDENRELPYKEGDILDLYVIAYNGNELRLSKALSGEGDLHIIGEAFRRAVPVEGKVKDQCKGGYHVEIMKKRVFCPISQIDLKYVENPDDYVGKTYLFLIKEFEEDGRDIIVSRREFLKQEQEKTRRQFLKEITIGTQLEGQVTKLAPFGAFVELSPGIEGMIHLSEIGWSRVERADDVLKAGDLVTVKIIGIEPGKQPGQSKIALSMRQITEDPWQSVQEKFSIGAKIRGKVKRCMKFGAFVEIAPGIEGLVHISEMSYKKRVLNPEDVVSLGETVDVMIKEIDVAKRRISLSIKDAEGDPWINIREKYSVGQSLEGVIEKREKFGCFVTLEPGITGLLPQSKIANSPKAASIEKLRQGDAIMVKVEEIYPDDRKITLGPADSMDEDDWRSFAKDKEKPIGSLGEKLQQAFKSKKETPIP